MTSTYVASVVPATYTELLPALVVASEMVCVPNDWPCSVMLENESVDGEPVV